MINTSPPVSNRRGLVVSLDLWHKRLERTDPSSITAMESENVVKGLRISNTMLDKKLFEKCEVAKMTRSLIPEISTT